jgi:DNA-binding phage protein
MEQEKDDIIIKILDELRLFKDLSLKASQSQLAENDMYKHMAKTGEVVKRLFQLLDEFETIVGDPSHLRDE